MTPPTATRASRSRHPTPDRALEVAATIGDYLCRTAYRHRDRCTWMGMSQVAGGDGGITMVFRTVGPELYGGTSGIALFLGELYRLTGDGRFAKTAVQAIHQALSSTNAVEPREQAGFYSGLIGIAFACVRVGWNVGRADFATTAAELVDRVAARLDETLLLDVISGAAGAIPALLVLSRCANRPAYVGVAEKLAAKILDVASRSEHGLSWDERATGFSAPRNLTGFAHGAAGMGWGLFELFRVTGDNRLRDAARSAFDYENHWFRPDLDNWPDFRNSTGEDTPAPCSTAWCHGAPGIGLSRLRALRIDGDRHDHDARAAVRSTMAVLRRASARGQDFTPCHGLAGLVELLLLAGEVLGDGAAADLAAETAAASAQAHERQFDSWTCGVLRGISPSLMVGLAGIGYLYLRLANATVPSFLALDAGQKWGAWQMPPAEP